MSVKICCFVLVVAVLFWGLVRAFVGVGQTGVSPVVQITKEEAPSDDSDFHAQQMGQRERRRQEGERLVRQLSLAGGSPKCKYASWSPPATINVAGDIYKIETVSPGILEDAHCFRLLPGGGGARHVSVDLLIADNEKAAVELALGEIARGNTLGTGYQIDTILPGFFKMTCQGHRVGELECYVSRNLCVTVLLGPSNTVEVVKAFINGGLSNADRIK